MKTLPLKTLEASSEFFLLKYLRKQEWDITAEYRHVLHLTKKFEIFKEFAKSVLDTLPPSLLEVSFLYLAESKTVVTVDRPQGRYASFEPQAIGINKVKFRYLWPPGGRATSKISIPQSL